jgi:hypothetical protein
MPIYKAVHIFLKTFKHKINFLNKLIIGPLQEM